MNYLFRLQVGWMTPFLAFRSALWMAVISTYLSFCVMNAIVNIMVQMVRGRRTNLKITWWKYLEDSIITTTGNFLLQSTPNSQMPKSRIGISLFVMLFTSIVILTSSYSSGLASSLTIPRYSGAIKTVKDLVESDVLWGAPSDAWIFSIMEDSRPDYVKLLGKFILANESTLKERGLGRFSYSVERLPDGYYAVGDYVEYENLVKNLRIMKEDLYWEQCVFMLRKSSVLLPLLDDLLLRIAQSGIVKVLEFQVSSYSKKM